MSTSDLNVVAENLAELLTSVITIYSQFYRIFFDPTPQLVTMQVYDENNELVEVEIPNRAMDRSIAISGEGSPEGAVISPVGTAYVDTLNSIVYFKIAGTGNTGWSPVVTQETIESSFRAYLTSEKYLNEDNAETFLQGKNYINQDSLNTALSTFVPQTLINVLEGSGTIILEDNSAYKITPTGTVTFMLPIIPNTDLGRLHKILVQVNMEEVHTINPGATKFFDKIIPDLSNVGMYNLLYEYDNANEEWVVGCISKGA